MTVAFLGLGIMGSLQAANLARAGHDLRVWTRTPGKAEDWAAEHGATACATPAEAAQGAEVVISMVVDGAQVESVLLGEDGAAASAPEGAVFADMSTIGPAAARDIGDRIEEAGFRFLDAPVTGSSPRAKDGTLTIMVGGSAEALSVAQPLFDVMGQLTVHAGAIGHGQLVKVINNAVGAANLATAAQALIVGRATGADLDALLQVLNGGSGGSAMLALKGPALLEHDYTTLFKLEHMLKDVRLCLEEAQAAGVPFPAASSVRDALSAGMGRGHADADFVALVESYEGLASRRI